MIEIARDLEDVLRRLEHLETAERRLPRARYTTAAGQTFSTGNDDPVDFGTLVYDTHSAVTTGANWVFTAPVGGYYHVDFMILFAATTGWVDGEIIEAYLYKNGGLDIVLFRSEIHGSGASVRAQAQGSSDIKLSSGDTIYIRLMQSSGGNLSLHNNANYNWITIHQT